MSPKTFWGGHMSGGFPRVSGDEPAGPMCLSPASRFSPRERG